jgi:hypothetical protein
MSESASFTSRLDSRYLPTSRLARAPNLSPKALRACKGTGCRVTVPHALHCSAWLRYSVTIADSVGTSTTW